MSCWIEPLEFNVVVELDPVEEVTGGGIILPTTVTERDKLGGEEGTLVAISPHAFSYADDWPADRPKPQVGQRVMIKRYDGLLRDRKVGGVEKTYRIVQDKSVVAILKDEEA